MSDPGFLSLDVSHPVWERFFSVAPLVVVGSREERGDYDLAPKHMAGPLGWDNYFVFVCAPSHTTYVNIRRDEVFTVSYPSVDQVVLTSLAASPRCEDGSKTALQALPTVPAETVPGVFLRDSYLRLECRLERIVDGFGRNSLIAGRVVAAHVESAALRDEDRDDQDVLSSRPLLAYLYPGRFAEIRESNAFPFPAGFAR